MWPLRAERLTDLIPVEELRLLLSAAGSASSAMTFCERTSEVDYHDVNAGPHPERDRPDPFCTFFRHGEVTEEASRNGRPGKKPAFDGADTACARC